MRLTLCVAIIGLLFFVYIGRNNELAQLQLELPAMEKRIALIQEENQQLRYAVDRFEHPHHLVELAHRPEFAHLKCPLFKEVLSVPDALVANE